MPIRADLGKIGGDDVHGRMPRRLRPPQRPEVVPEVDRINHRGEEGKLRLTHRRLALRHLLLLGVLGHSLALTGFGCHGGRERGEESGAVGDWGQWEHDGGRWRQGFQLFRLRKKKGGSRFQNWRDTEGK